MLTSLLWIFLFQSLVLVCSVKNPRNAWQTPEGMLSVSARMKENVQLLSTLCAAAMEKLILMAARWNPRLALKKCQFMSWGMVIVVSRCNCPPPTLPKISSPENTPSHNRRRKNSAYNTPSPILNSNSVFCFVFCRYSVLRDLWCSFELVLLFCVLLCFISHV